VQSSKGIYLDNLLPSKKLNSTFLMYFSKEILSLPSL